MIYVLRSKGMWILLELEWVFGEDSVWFVSLLDVGTLEICWLLCLLRCSFLEILYPIPLLSPGVVFYGLFSVLFSEFEGNLVPFLIWIDGSWELYCDCEFVICICMRILFVLLELVSVLCIVIVDGSSFHRC